MVAIGKISYWTRAADEVRTTHRNRRVYGLEIMTQEKPAKPEFIFYEM